MNKKGISKTMSLLVCLMLGLLFTTAVIFQIFEKFIQPDKLDATFIQEDMQYTIDAIEGTEYDGFFFLFLLENNGFEYVFHDNDFIIKTKSREYATRLKTNLEIEDSDSNGLGIIKRGNHISFDVIENICASYNEYTKYIWHIDGEESQMLYRAKTVLQDNPKEEANIQIIFKNTNEDKVSLKVAGNQRKAMEAFMCKISLVQEKEIVEKIENCDNNKKICFEFTIGKNIDTSSQVKLVNDIQKALP